MSSISMGEAFNYANRAAAQPFMVRAEQGSILLEFYWSTGWFVW